MVSRRCFFKSFKFPVGWWMHEGFNPSQIIQTHRSPLQMQKIYIYAEQFCIFLIITTLIMPKCFTSKNSNSYCFSSGFLSLVHNSYTPHFLYHVDLVSFILTVRCNGILVKRFDPLAVTHRASYFQSSFSHWKIAQCSAKIKLLLYKQSFLPAPHTCSFSKVPTVFHCTFYRLKARQNPLSKVHQKCKSIRKAIKRYFEAKDTTSLSKEVKTFKCKYQTLKQGP